MSIKAIVTFGQNHIHTIDNKIFDRNCVAMLEDDTLEAAETKAFKLFGMQFCMIYEESEFNPKDMQYYPRGKIKIN